MPKGVVFTYEALGLDGSEYVAATKAVERLIKRGEMKRVNAGRFYKPRASLFGELRPNEEELLKPYLFSGGKRVAYVTGISLYNRMGLTTQISSVIQVASRSKRVTATLGNTRVKPVKGYVEVTKENVRLLEILDALKDFTSIPDLDKRSAITLLSNQIMEMNEKAQANLISCALQYPPRVRAFLGALLDAMGQSHKVGRLRNSLNPLSQYSLGLDGELLRTAEQWSIY